MSGTACSFYGKPKGLVWHLRPNGFPACTGGIAPFLYTGTALGLIATCVLTCQLFLTFKSYRSLYFWSYAITTWSLGLHALGLLLLRYDWQGWDQTRWQWQVALLLIGYCCMITGFSVVLYSRLHLLDATRRWRRPLLLMIAVVAIVCHPTTIVLETYPVLHPPADITGHLPWFKAWGIWQRTRPWIFFLCNVVITSLYIKAALEFVRTPRDTEAKWLSVRENRVVVRLIVLQALVWTLDLAIVSIGMARVFILVDVATSVVYAVKLKLEFVFLNQLVSMANPDRSDEVIGGHALREHSQEV